jgi:hypothetical protein
VGNWGIGKQNGRPACANRPNLYPNRGLQRLDVGSLQALGATHDFKLNGLAVVQGLVAFRLDCGKVYEYIFPGLALNEAKALAGVKPLHGSLFFAHFLILFSSIKLSGALLANPLAESSIFGCVLWIRQAGTKKGRKFDPATATQHKGDTRATNAAIEYQNRMVIARASFQKRL